MAHLSRVPDWPARLAAVFAQAQRTGFAWGRQDCMLFVADCIAAMTGEDPAVPDFRGRYTTEIGARRRMKAVCGGGVAETLEIAIAARYGVTDVPPAFAQRGDVVLVRTDLGDMGGVVAPNGRDIALMDQHGLRFVPVTAATRAWRI